MATNNAVNTGLSGTTGSVHFVGSTSPTLVTPTLGAATATSITFSPTTDGIVGTTTNDSAGAGYVGEYINANLSSVSAQSMTNVALNVISISLTAGDWDVGGNMTAIAPGNYAAVAQTVVASISTTSATVAADASLLGAFSFNAITGNTYFGIVVPTVRITIASTTTVYLVGQNNFATNAMSVCGSIWARRRR